MLFIGGEFLGVGGVATEGVAVFGCNPTLSPCIGDANRDQRVTFSDITAVLGEWGQSGSLADTDQDGIVGFRDISSVLFSWGADCTVESPPASSTTSALLTSDVNGDGVIDFTDTTAALSGAISGDK